MNDLHRIPPPRFPDVLLRRPPNRTIIGFFSLLGAAHLAVAIPAALHARWEGYLSFVLAAIFLTLAVIAMLFRSEIALQASRGQIRLRMGILKWRSQRVIPFDAVTAVKLTFAGGEDGKGQIAIVCLAEEIECPPTRVPRQEALLLAMMLGVTLIKVDRCVPPAPSVISSGSPRSFKE